MLIVSAWQHVPFKKLSSTVKEKSILKIFVMLICAASFVVFNTPIAATVCAIFAVIVSKLSPKSRKEETV
jgi:hypothetical protein